MSDRSDHQYATRRNAVRQVRAGKAVFQVAAALGVTRQAIHRWISQASERGIYSLRPKAREPELYLPHLFAMLNAFADKHDEPNGRQVQQIIRDRFGVDRSISQANRIKNKWIGLYQKLDLLQLWAALEAFTDEDDEPAEPSGRQVKRIIRDKFDLEISDSQAKRIKSQWMKSKAGEISIPPWSRQQKARERIQESRHRNRNRSATNS